MILLDRIADFFGGLPVRMWTLTLRYANRATNLGAAWNRLRLVISRDFGRFRYVWFKEFTVKGVRHLHIIIEARIDWDRKRLRAEWKNASGSRSNWIVNEGKASVTWKDTDNPDHYFQIENPAGYAAKYITKGDFSDFDKSERRYGFSTVKPEEAWLFSWRYISCADSDKSPFKKPRLLHRF